MFDDESFLGQVKRLLVGQPIPSSLAHHERLSKATGLAVLSSDALSSVAYATEEVLRVLMIGGLAAMTLVARRSALLIAALLAVVAFSYRQTIKAYPRGGGDYMVAKENLSETAGLSAAAALLIDYTLTVAVSVAAGVAAITSAFPDLHISRVDAGDRVRVAADGRQPARHPRVGAHLRGADLRLHRRDAAARRRRASCARSRGRARRSAAGRAAADLRHRAADDVCCC